MAKVLTKDGSVCIGVYTFPDKKKPRLCIRKGSSIVQYGIFNNADAADAFMNELAQFVGAVDSTDGETV